MMMGLKASLSFLFGSVIGWAIVGPLLLRAGIVVRPLGYSDIATRPSAQIYVGGGGGNNLIKL
jgi:hypothetical protein